MFTGRLMQRLGVLVATTVAVVGLGGCSGSADSLTVVITTPSWSSEHGPFLLADKLGFLGEEGVSVEYELAKSGTESVQQLISGNAQVAVATGEPVVIAAQQGTGLQYFMPYYGHVIYGLVAIDGSGISSVADLKGKRVGITNANSTGATILRNGLATAGLTEQDVTMVPIGVGAQQLSAIRNGDVDALAMWDTLYANLKAQGVNTNAIPVPGMEDLFGGGLIASADALAENPQLYEKFGRAVAKAFAWSRLHPEEAVQMMWDALPELRPGPGQDESKVLADQVTYMNTRLGALIPDPTTTSWTTMSDDEVAGYIDWAAEAGLITSKPAVADVLTNKLSTAIGQFSPTELRPVTGA